MYLQFFNNVILNKTKVLLPWPYVALTNVCYHCLDPLIYMLTMTFTSFDFPIF